MSDPSCRSFALRARRPSPSGAARLALGAGVAVALGACFTGSEGLNPPTLDLYFPTGIVVSQQDEKSQIKNRAKAMKVLRSRLYEMELRKQQDAIAKDRKSQVGSGERSEKIRTYNFPQSRITDHRINTSVHNTVTFMDGDIQELLDALVAAEHHKRMMEELGGTEAA